MSRKLGLILLAASLGNRYQRAWEFLQTHPNPTRFDDAKFGIYFHWGPYSVPAFDTEGYSRNMYRPEHRDRQHHLPTFGAPNSGTKISFRCSRVTGANF